MMSHFSIMGRWTLDVGRWTFSAFLGIWSLGFGISGALAAPAKVVFDTKTHAMSLEDGSSILDASGITLTLGGYTMKDSAGIQTINLGSVNGTRLVGKMMFFDAATPIVKPTGSLLTAIAALHLVGSPTINFSELAGAASAAQIPALDAAKITTGTLALARIPTMDASHIPALDAAKITTGAFDPARIPSLDAAKITTGIFDLNRIPTMDAAHIPALDATKITTGAFDPARIPSLDAAKITTGAFDPARIPALDAAKITTGAFDTARIPALDFSKITTGTVPKVQLPAVTAYTDTANTFVPLQTFNSLNTYGATAIPLSNPGAPSITNLGTPGATTVTYKIVAKLADSTTVTAAGPAGTTTTSNATLDATNKNSLTWSAVTGASSYDVYRTTAGLVPSTTGKIANVTSPAYIDAGAAGDSATPPAVNNTGSINAVTGTYTTLNATTANVTALGANVNAAGFRITNLGATSTKLVDYLPANAVQDASVNYSTELAAAITAAYTTRVLELPEFPIRITAPIVITSPLLIRGRGGYGPVTADSNASRLVWGGTGGATMLTFTAQNNIGGGLEFVTLDGNSLAASLLDIEGSSFGHYNYCAFINFTTGDGIKIAASGTTASWNHIQSPYIDGLSGSNQDGHSGIWFTSTGGGGNACWNTINRPTVFHGGNRPGLILGNCDNNHIQGYYGQRQPGGTGAGVVVDPTEAVGMPIENVVDDIHCGAGGWVQPGTTVNAPATITNYKLHNGSPVPVTNVTPLYWTDSDGKAHGGTFNGVRIEEGSNGGLIDLGEDTGHRFYAYHLSTVRYGQAIEANEYRFFSPTGAHISLGRVSTADGTTWDEGFRFYAGGGTALGAAVADPGVGHLAMSGSIKVSTAISARAYNNSDLTIADATATAITFNSERWDSDGIHSTSSNTTRMTCVTPGIYSMTGNASWDVNATGTRQIYLRVNGSLIISVGNVLPGLASQEVDANVSGVYDLSTGDYVELIARQTSGGSLLLKSHTAYTPELTVTRLP